MPHWKNLFLKIRRVCISTILIIYIYNSGEKMDIMQFVPDLGTGAIAGVVIGWGLKKSHKISNSPYKSIFFKFGISC